MIFHPGDRVRYVGVKKNLSGEIGTVISCSFEILPTVRVVFDNVKLNRRDERWNVSPESLQKLDGE